MLHGFPRFENSLVLISFYSNRFIHLCIGENVQNAHLILNI